MPQQSQNNNQSSSKEGGGSGYTPKSDYAYMKEGWGGYNNFMASYGLKPYNDSDVQEGKAILQAFREADEEAHNEKNNRGK